MLEDWLYAYSESQWKTRQMTTNEANLAERKESTQQEQRTESDSNIELLLHIFFLPFFFFSVSLIYIARFLVSPFIFFNASSHIGDVSVESFSFIRREIYTHSCSYAYSELLMCMHDSSLLFEGFIISGDWRGIENQSFTWLSIRAYKYTMCTLSRPDCNFSLLLILLCSGISFFFSVLIF